MNHILEAYRLINRFHRVGFLKDYGGMDTDLAIECTNILVSEMIDEHIFDESAYGNRRFEFWTEVKKELEKMPIE